MRLESPSKPYQNGAPAAILFRYGLSCFSNALKINTILLDIFCYEPKKKKEITDGPGEIPGFFCCRNFVNLPKTLTLPTFHFFTRRVSKGAPLKSSWRGCRIVFWGILTGLCTPPLTAPSSSTSGSGEISRCSAPGC